MDETVIGVASAWAYSEVQLLDELGENKKASVFDINLFKAQEQIRVWFSIDNIIMQTPVYAELESGRSVKFSQSVRVIHPARN